MLAEQTNWVSNAIAGLALGVASLSLYLQRRDDRPRLTISTQNKYVAPEIPDGGGGRMAGPTKEPAQIFEIRNVGRLPVRIESVQARWLWGRPFPVTCDWNGASPLDSDTKCEATLFTSELFHETPTGLRERAPFYRVEFLDAVGRRWSAGLRRAPTYTLDTIRT